MFLDCWTKIFRDMGRLGIYFSEAVKFLSSMIDGINGLRFFSNQNALWLWLTYFKDLSNFHFYILPTTCLSTNKQKMRKQMRGKKERRDQSKKDKQKQTKPVMCVHYWLLYFLSMFITMCCYQVSQHSIIGIIKMNSLHLSYTMDLG